MNTKNPVLNRFFIEKFSIEFPSFPAANIKPKHHALLRCTIGIFYSNKNPNKFALKLTIETTPNRKRKKEDIAISASVIGLFSKIDASKDIRTFAKGLGKKILYTKLLESSNKIEAFAPIKGFHLPRKI